MRDDFTGPGGASLAEARAFLDANPEVQGIDLALIDCHGIARGKTIRRHELDSLFTRGRGIPGSIFAQDVTGDDVEETGLVWAGAGGDCLCWPIGGTLGLMPATGRGHVLISMWGPDGQPFAPEPRNALRAQVARAEAMGFAPMGALELEFYLIDRDRDGDGRHRPARYLLSGRKTTANNCMSVDELDEMSPFFDAVYAGARALDLPMETLISEYAAGQYELTLRYRGLMRAADDAVIAKRLIRATARRFGMEACFMAKPFGHQAGSGMHLHLSLADGAGRNLFADPGEGVLSPLMLQAIGGIRATIGDTMLVLAPFQNSWRRFASAVYSPADDTWGVENRTVALRVPGGNPAARHFEHRVAGVDANPYLVAAITLGGALDGIEAKADPGPPVTGVAAEAGHVPDLPRGWLEAIERFERSEFCHRILGPAQHRGFAAVKRAEYQRLALTVTEAEWELYGFTV